MNFTKYLFLVLNRDFILSDRDDNENIMFVFNNNSGETLENQIYDFIDSTFE